MSDSDASVPDVAPLDSDDIVTVSTLNAELASVIEGATDLHHDYVVGDVTDYGIANGHAHFDLVDDDATIHCVVFGFRRSNFDVEPEEDMRVAVSGDLSFYEAGGSCSILVTDLVPVGESEYQQRYEQARAQLDEAGLLDDAHKQPLPELPRTVGLITSADSDAATDAVTAIHARYPKVDIKLKHASVQGDHALEDLLEAISVLDRDPAVDVLVLTRGGGADKTLQVFNDPALCRVVAETDTPICVGIGHENDRTLADEVADKRVMTPTHAGEIVPERRVYEDQFDTLERSLASAYESLAERRLDNLEANLDRAYEHHVSTNLQAFERDLQHASETHAVTRLTDLENRLDSAYRAVEQAKAYEEEKAAAVQQAKQEATTLTAQQRRRYIITIAVLIVLLVALIAYILL
jgi:exodeoxyribonuclease VII large subunit